MPFGTLKAFLKRTPGKLAVAVSGGADSLCLFLAMQESGREFSVVHCNHGLRGKESDKDEEFVRELCKGVKLKVFKKKIGKGPGIEERARVWRRECYANCGARYVFLGHHAGDQVETLLLNLMRGSALKGAGAMRPIAALEGTKVRLARPWLGIDPKVLKQALKERGQNWREDASNQDLDLKRNALRHGILPKLEKILPGAIARMAAFSMRAAEAADLLDKMAARELKRAKTGSGWDRKVFLDQESGMRRLMLKMLGGKAVDAAAVDRAEAILAKGRGTVDLRRGFQLETNPESLYLRKHPQSKA